MFMAVEKISFNSLAEVDFRGKGFDRVVKPSGGKKRKAGLDYASERCHLEIHFGPQSINTLQYFC